jgi:hypothetical protein
MTDYVASPRSTDPADLLREAQIRVRHLKALLEHSDHEIGARERTIQELYLERG